MPWSRIKTDYIEPDFYGKEITGQRRLTYSESLNEALSQALEIDSSVFVMGQGVDDPSGMFGSTKNLQEKYGAKRVFDTPLAETALTGIAAGAAMAGMKPVYFHNRPDFLYLALDQLANHAAKWSYMFAGKVSVPLVIWACIGRGWGSGAQHSQALQGLFMHIPGLKLVMPSTCYDTKGLMLTAIKDPNPVIIIDHRMNYRNQGYVPEKMYTIPFGKGVKRRNGSDVTVVAISHMVTDSLLAAEELYQEEKIDVEIIDPRTLCPLDEELILASVLKTGRLVIVDMGWKTGGVSAEIASLVVEKGFSSLKAPIKRVTCPDLPTPSGYTLEDVFYIDKNQIKKAVVEAVLG
ncbi:MAG: alpha-ketoacid dehydrogenase subunit beta [Desulfobacteraceae bacterium]|nr:alpha-ketoacid dehydrogenase subunit beta [Desulfobacteraceae bacterium]